jgi:hypothetical protein
MAWSLEGTYFENCSCDMVCPCITSAFAKPADQERCRGAMAFHVDRGEVDGIDVGGKNLVVVFDAPALMGEGNWRIGLIMDATASPEQTEKLGAVFGGQVGGPMAALTPLIGEMLGMEAATIDYADDGRRHSVRVGDLIDMEIEDAVSPASPSGEVMHLTGLFHHPSNSTLTVAQATRSRIDAFGMSFTQTGKNGHSAPFAWSS